MYIFSWDTTNLAPDHWCHCHLCIPHRCHPVYCRTHCCVVDVVTEQCCCCVWAGSDTTEPVTWLRPTLRPHSGSGHSASPHSHPAVAAAVVVVVVVDSYLVLWAPFPRPELVPGCCQRVVTADTDHLSPLPRVCLRCKWSGQHHSHWSHRGPGGRSVGWRTLRGTQWQQGRQARGWHHCQYHSHHCHSSQCRVSLWAAAVEHNVTVLVWHKVTWTCNKAYTSPKSWSLAYLGVGVGVGDWHGEGVSGAGEGVLGSVSISRAGDTQPPQPPVLSLVRCQCYIVTTCHLPLTWAPHWPGWWAGCPPWAWAAPCCRHRDWPAPGCTCSPESKRRQWITQSMEYECKNDDVFHIIIWYSACQLAHIDPDKKTLAKNMNESISFYQCPFALTVNDAACCCPPRPSLLGASSLFLSHSSFRGFSQSVCSGK